MEIKQNMQDSKMSKYKVFTSQEFDKKYNKLDTSVKLQIDRILEQVKENPHIGKPLGFDFFREKKTGKFRLYYLIYEEYVVVFVINISDKKDQQEVINAIRNFIPFYRQEIEKMFKQN